MERVDTAGQPILQIAGLRVRFGTPRGVVRAVTDVSFDIRPGEAVGLVGESGCGKSATALAVMRLLPAAQASVSGQILFDGRVLLRLLATGDARHSRSGSFDDLSEPNDLSESGVHGWPSDH